MSEDGSNPGEVGELLPQYVDWKTLPADFPIGRHTPDFWEALGRAVATFGFLEDVLGKAIYALTATREIPTDPAEAQAAYEAWLPKMQHALTDTLNPLIDTFGQVASTHPEVKLKNLDMLLGELRKAAEWRNVICHGSWSTPDASGRSVPHFVNRQLEVIAEPVDIAFLDQLRSATVEMTCAVMNTVTTMGWQFPGSSGGGKPVWFT